MGRLLAVLFVAAALTALPGAASASHTPGSSWRCQSDGQICWWGFNYLLYGHELSGLSRINYWYAMLLDKRNGGTTSHGFGGQFGDVCEFYVTGAVWRWAIAGEIPPGCSGALMAWGEWWSGGSSYLRMEIYV